jgi:hypothetical protein
MSSYLLEVHFILFLVLLQPGYTLYLQLLKMEVNKEEMKNIYYSIFFLHYKIIQLGRAGKLWSACSSSVVMAFTITLCLHFLLGWIVGKHLMIVYNSTLYGTILLLSLIVFNLMLFISNNNFLKIEMDIQSSKYKYRKAILIALIYLIQVIIIFLFIGF